MTNAGLYSRHTRDLHKTLHGLHKTLFTHYRTLLATHERLTEADPGFSERGFG